MEHSCRYLDLTEPAAVRRAHPIFGRSLLFSWIAYNRPCELPRENEPRPTMAALRSDWTTERLGINRKWRTLSGELAPWGEVTSFACIDDLSQIGGEGRVHGGLVTDFSRMRFCPGDGFR